MERDPCCTIGDYLLLDRVERSEGSVISRAVHLSTQKMVTVKLLDRECFMRTMYPFREINQFNGSFSTNISFLKKLDHDNVVKVLEGLSLNQSIPVSGSGYPFRLRSVVVMEYCYGSDLRHWFREAEDWGHASKLNFFSQMVDGVNYLHEQNIFHGRIQPSNVWIQGGCPMLCGFGLGNPHDGSSNESERLYYAAPEIFDYLDLPYPPGKKSDVFSLGILLVQLHSEQRNFGGWGARLGHCLFHDVKPGDPFEELPHQNCLTNFMKRLAYLMIYPVYHLRIGVELVKDMLNNEMN